LSRDDWREQDGIRSDGSQYSDSIAYKTDLGLMLEATIEEGLMRPPLDSLKAKVNLIFTSPPFPLTKKKRYGNLRGAAYLKWMTKIIKRLARLITPDGSLVIEIGNAWEKGQPVMSTLPIETLLAVLKGADLYLCQQFICHNPARLPGPAQWVNIERIRIKDSFTHVWWMSPTNNPKADNRNVLIPYSKSMRRLLKKGKYNAGTRPSGHRIGDESFLKNHGGAIPANVLYYANTSWNVDYSKWCREIGVPPHPARMSPNLAEFFIKFLTDVGDLVLDPFAGSNTTGAVAESLGRKWIAIEPKSDYVLGSLGRFKQLSLGFKRDKTKNEK